MKSDNRLRKCTLQQCFENIIPFGPPVDSLVELSLHKVAVKPVSAHLYSCIHNSRTKDGTFERLQSNLRILEKNKVEELGGSAGVGVPDSASLERIQQRWTSLHEVYSPNKKVQILLKVCKSIYHSMSANASSGSMAFSSCNVSVSGLAPCLFLSFLISFLNSSSLLISRYSVWSR